MWVDQTLESASGSLHQLLTCLHKSIDEVNKLALCLLQSFCYVFSLCGMSHLSTMVGFTHVSALVSLFRRRSTKEPQLTLMNNLFCFYHLPVRD